MREYRVRTRIPMVRLALLASGTILLAVIAGATAYWIAGLLWIPVVSPLVLGFVVAVCFAVLVGVSKIHHARAILALGLVVAIVVALSFYATPYVVLRRNLVGKAVAAGVDAETANARIDAEIKEKSGSAGFLGYMIMRADAGEHFEGGMLVGGAAQPMSLVLNSGWAWAYWLLEVLLVIWPVAAVNSRFRPFSESADEWYGTARLIGSVPVDAQERLLDLFHSGNPYGIGQLMALSRCQPYPRIEIAGSQTSHREGDTLLTLTKTSLRRPAKLSNWLHDGRARPKLARTHLGAWEVPPPELAQIVAALTERNPDAGVQATGPM